MKYTKYVVVLGLLLLLTGCKSVEISRNEFMTSIDKEFDHMIEISDNELKNIYGIDLNNFNEYIFKISYNDPLNAYVFVLPSGSKRNASKEIDKFFDYLSKLSDENNEIIDNILDENIDDYLVYIVSDKNKEIYDKLFNEFKTDQESK